MPIYVYECPVCKNLAEVLVKYEDIDDPIICKLCLEETNNIVHMKRLIKGSPTIVFRGDGFYSTEKIQKKVKLDDEQ